MDIRKLAAAAVILSMAVACNKTPEPEDSLSVKDSAGFDVSAVTVGNAGGETSYTVESNFNWTARGDASWITVSPKEGKAGNTKVKLSSAYNSESFERNGNMVFYKSGEVFLKIPVTQEAGSGLTGVPDIEVTLRESQSNDMTYSYDSSTGVYSFTTGSLGDPYVFTNALKEQLQSGHIIFSFEYTASKDVDNFQLFFPSPRASGGGLSEARSALFGAMAKTSSWKEFSCNIGTCRSTFDNWGYSGDYLRLDFGHTTGNSIKVRNLRFRQMNEAEREAYEQEINKAEGKAARAARLEAYLSRQYSVAHVSDVSVGATTITVKGTVPSESGYSIADIAPWEDIAEMESFPNATPITQKDFTLEIPRTVSRDGLPSYDRVLSKWAIVSNNSLVSHARYADAVEVKNGPAEMKPATKKGLGGYFAESTQTSDLDELGITSVTVNVVLNVMINTTSSGDYSITHSYGGKTYYMSKSQVSMYDKQFKACASRNIVTSAIILVRSSDTNAATKILTHPDCNGGNYTMPNLTSAESVNLYAAALDFLASRYNGGSYGRINHWIMHNEVDFSSEWTNMGEQPEMLYMDAYVKSMRICYLLARKYDSFASSLISLTHCWAKADGQYAPKSLLADLNLHSGAEGDFYWGVAYHPYPQDLSRPEFWKNDTQSTYSANSNYCTFKNLEVVNDWALTRANWYKGEKKRILFLSENGTNSPSYSDSDLAKQAAGACWMWKKVSVLGGIDAVQWHNWRDNKAEAGLRIGLRKFPEEGGGTKPVWDVYKAAGTVTEDTVFQPYLSVIGISDWSGISQPIQ